MTREYAKISIVVPSGRIELLCPCLRDVLVHTTYPNFEILLTVNEILLRNEKQAAYLNEFAEDPRVRVLVYQTRDFNYSASTFGLPIRQAGLFFVL